MNQTADRISLHQAMKIFILAAASSILRMLPSLVAGEAGRASWVSVLFAVIPFALLLWMLGALLRGGNNWGLADSFQSILGRPVAKIILALTGVWIFLLISVYARYFGERFASTVMPDIPVPVFIAAILFLVYIVARGRLDRFARCMELLLFVFVISIVVVLVFSNSKVQAGNVWPVTVYDMPAAARGSYYFLPIWSLVTFWFFLGNRITRKNELKRRGIYVTVGLALLSLLAVLLTVGVFGYVLTGENTVPFYMYLKTVVIFGAIERIEAVFIGLWVINDFAMLGMLIFVFRNLVGSVAGTGDHPALATPVLLLAFSFSQFLAFSQFELEQLVRMVVLPGNLVFAVGIPFAVFLTGKLRRKI